MGTSPGGIHTLAVFGGSGATGKAIIRQALAKGFSVRTLVRDVRSMNIKSGMLEIIEGSPLRSGDVELCLKGSDAAICVIGPRPPYTDIFCEAATGNIVEIMRRLGLKRLVCQTGAMIGDYPANRSLPFRVMVRQFNRRLPLIARDRAAQETVVTSSGLVWTIVKPSRLTERTPTGKWRAGPNVRTSLLSSISRYDLASFLVQEALNPQFPEQVVFIRN